MASVSFEHVRKDYGGVPVLHDFDLHVDDGELVVLVGGSGSGKSTALRLLAGLEVLSAGAVRIGERDVTQVAPRDRDVAMVFQDYALYPHLTARENIALGLRLRKLSRAEVERRVAWAAEALGLGPLLERRPRHLSGGQRQRVAMGRAMVREPAVFLFDEPLSNLDTHLRGQMRLEISRLQRRLGTTTLYVTHDQVEAMTLADRLVVLEAGRIQQVGRPLDVYRAPANRFVAGFIGSPPMNFLEGRLLGGAEGMTFESEGCCLLLPRERWPADDSPLDAVTLGIRPEGLTLSAQPGPTTLSGQLVLAEVLGAVTHTHVEAGPHRLTAVLPSERPLAAGALVHLAVDMERVHLFGTDGASLLTSQANPGPGQARMPV